jgi:hypothetical protein
MCVVYDQDQSPSKIKNVGSHARTNTAESFSDLSSQSYTEGSSESLDSVDADFLVEAILDYTLSRWGSPVLERKMSTSNALIDMVPKLPRRHRRQRSQSFEA